MMKKHRDWIQVLKAYQKTLTDSCGIQVILEPSEVKPERFHVELSTLAHPVIVGNGRVAFRLRASICAEIPPSERGISDALQISLTLADFFANEQSVTIADGVYAMAYHKDIRADDDMFTDLSDDRSYSYDEHYLVQLEFDYEKTAEAVTQKLKE